MRGVSIGVSYISDVDSKINTHSISPELIINVDQTPSSYVSVGKQTMSARGSKSVPIEGLTDKRSMHHPHFFCNSFWDIYTHASNFIPEKLKPPNPTTSSFQKDFVSPRTRNIG